MLTEHHRINKNENHTERIVQFLIGNEIEQALKALKEINLPVCLHTKSISCFSFAFLRGLVSYIMSEERIEPTPIDLGEYKFGFHDENVELVASTGKGLNEEVIREMSRIKGEPEWMLEFRLKSYETFKKMPMQTWGADLSELDFDDIVYYQNRQISQHAAGTMCQTKSKKPLNASVFQKPSVLTWQELLPSTNQKWFTIT